DGSGGGRFHRRKRRVGERPVQLSGKKKTRIDLGNDPRPKPRNLRLDVSVKRSVDFDCIKAAGHDLQRMPLSSRHAGRVQDPFPVLVRPSGGTYADLAEWNHSFI